MAMTYEQLEAILSGEAAEPADLSEADRARLDEAGAIRGRLRAAFAGVRVAAPLAERITTALRAAAHGETTRPLAPGESVRAISLARWLAPVGVAAAVMIVTALLHLAGRPAAAAPAELARIHNDNLAGAGAFFAADDPGRAAEYLKRRLGFAPRMCPHDGHMHVVGCCVARFRGQAAATYLLAVGGEKVSVIVTDEAPQDMGLTCKCGCGLAECRCFHTGRCGGSNIVSVRIGKRSYSAVGSASTDVLKDLLGRLRA